MIKNFFSSYKKEIALLFLMILLSCLMVAILLPKFGKIGTDTALYAIIGKNFIEGRGFTLFGEPHTVFSPLLPIFIGIFYFFVGNLDLAAHFATIFFAILSLPLIFLLVKQISTARVAIISVVFYTFNGFLIWNYATVPTPQIPVAFFSILIFLALLRVSDIKNELDRKDILWLFVLGLSTGFAYLTRPEYFFLIFPILFYIFCIYRKTFSSAKIVLMIATVFLGFALLALPYILYLYNNLDYWTINGRSNEVALVVGAEKYETLETYNSTSSNTAIITPPKSDKGLAESFIENFYTTIKTFFDNLWINQFSFLQIFGILGISFFAFGIREFVLLKSYHELWITLIMFVPLIFISIVVEGGKTNYLIQFLYLFIIFIAIGYDSFFDQVISKIDTSKTKRQIIFIVLILSLVFYNLFYPVIQNYLFQTPDYKPSELKELGIWTKDNIPGISNEIIMARKPDVSFYAGAVWELIPPINNLEKLKDVMQLKKIKYVVMDDRSMGGDWQEVKILLDPINTPSGFNIKKEFDYFGHRAVIYELVSEN